MCELGSYQERLKQPVGARGMAIETARDPRESSDLVLRGPRRLALRQRVAVFCLLLSDLLVGFGGLGAMFGGALYAAGGEQAPATFAEILAVGIVPSLLLWIMLRLFLGLYPGYGVDPAQELRLQTYSSVMALVVISFAALMLGIGKQFVYLLLPLGVFGLVMAAPIARAATKWALVRTGLWGKPVVVLGSGEMAARLVRTMLKDRGQGFRPVAVFSDDEAETSPAGVAGVPYLQGRDRAPEFARTYRINTAVLAVGDVHRAGQDRLADWASTKFERVIVVPNLTGLSSSAMAAHDLAGVLGVEVKHNLLDPRARRIKRAIDLAGAVLGGVLILPLMCLIALLIKLDSPGPVLFAQERPGLNGQRFRLYKFRTMWTDAEQRVEELMENDPAAKEYFEKHGKLKDDLRVTRVGRWLRKFSLDELPQLWNVLKGDMSLVGPRPYLLSQVPQMSGAEMVILRILPGISGLWQVSGRSDLAFEQRIEMDTYYVRNWSVWLDLVILFRTVLSVVLRRGAY